MKDITLETHVTPEKDKHAAANLDVQVDHTDIDITKKYPGIDPKYCQKFFISDKRALVIVNSQKKMYKRWLKTCKITPKGTSALNKQVLLETIDKIVEAKMKAPVNLIESFTKQLRKEAVDDELHYLGVPKSLTTGMKLADRRNIIN